MYKILVTIDGSEHSSKTIQEAIRRAEPVDAAVTLLHVAETPSYTDYYKAFVPSGTVDGDELRKNVEALEQEYADNADNIVNKAAQAFKEKGLEVEKSWKEGRPADVICSEAEEGAFDLVVIGNKGTGAFGGFFMGSVANETINCIKNRVLVVK